MKRTIIVTALLPLAVLAGCAAGPAPGVATADGGPTAQPAADGGTASTDPQEQGRLFAQCMRDNGIADFPDPNPDGPTSFSLEGGADEQQKFQAANKACEQFAPGKGGDATEVDQAQLEKFREFSQCMRDHGISAFPDPKTDGGGIQVELGDGLDPDSDAFKSAQDACKDLVPPPPDGGGMRVDSGGGPAGGGA
jgi:hypothetical protein